MTGFAKQNVGALWALSFPAGRVLWLMLLLVQIVMISQSAQAQTYTTLHSFGQGTDGASPAGGVSGCVSGRYACGFLGTTQIGGQYGYGTVFHLVNSHGTWTETIVHSFTGADGAGPQDSPVAGKGTTPFGVNGGGGTLYSIDLLNFASITILYNFCGQPDCDTGDNAYASPSPYGTGSGTLLFGTMAAGGTDNGGVIYELNLQTGVRTVVYNFVNGDPLYSRLTEDPRTLNSPIFYGTTYLGGDYSQGAVFEFDASTEAVTYLHYFLGGSDGANPEGGVTADATGDLYGVTSKGGAHGFGTVFKVSSSGAESVLYSFTGGADGGTPEGLLLLDGSGNLYGTATKGGAGYGTLFELSASGVFSVLHTFCTVGGCPDGEYPSGPLLLTGGTTLYGTASGGGAYGGGVVYELTLP
jgi:uncharacterized repeat protein (TIGR03803 family)